MANYKDMTNDDFDNILRTLIEAYTPEQILAIPGVYEIVAEELNNDVLDRWEQDNLELAYPEDSVPTDDC